jgi:TetR/AcrR family transcriptional regulator, cholesterol catabolism regulator
VRILSGLEIKEHIITRADVLFCQYGIKSVTMDDIAKHLGISKKTIYLHFSDKNALVVELIRNKMQNQVCVMDNCIDNSANAVHEVFFAVTQMQHMLSNMNPMLFYDLQKYHPEAWQLYVAFREKKLFAVIYNNIKRGIGEGYYRSEINADILTWMRIGQIDTVFGQTTYPANQFNMAALMAEITEHFLYGLCTAKGHKLIDKYKNTIQQD